MKIIISVTKSKMIGVLSPAATRISINVDIISIEEVNRTSKLLSIRLNIKFNVTSYNKYLFIGSRFVVGRI